MYGVCLHIFIYYNIAGSGGLDERSSMHGSVVYGPDGELINIGGTILPHLRPTDAIHDISDANLAPGLRGETDQYLKFLIF